MNSLNGQQTAILLIISVLFIFLLSWKYYRCLKSQKILRVENEKLREDHRIQTQAFSEIVHELRTPLTMILLPLDDLIQNHRKNPRHDSHLLDTVHRNTLRLKRLSDEFLEVIRCEKSPLALNRQTLCLTDWVPTILDLLRPLAQSQDLTLKYHCSGDKRAISADSLMLEKVILNLLTNAIKFTPKSGVILTHVQFEEDKALIHVQDNGSGIPQEELEYIFNRFYTRTRSTSTDQTSPPGVGIGLALARKLVEKHGGSLTVKSELGFGTVFTVNLPYNSKPELIEERLKLSNKLI